MRVLIVDDHPDTRYVLERFCSRRGYQVVVAGSLQAGIDLLRTEPFDAIISDIALPDGTGYALISEARLWGNRALGIALSAYPYPSAVDEPKITGFDYHLRKPCSFAELDSLLEQGSGGGEDFGGSTEA
jgi:CheY-like chemotaxis protein